MILGLLAQTDAVQEMATPEKRHLLHLIWNADPLVQLCLLILFCFSVVCWAIIIAKHRQIKGANAQTQKFYEAFWSTPKLEDLANRKGVRSNPAYNIFHVARQSIESNKSGGRSENIVRNIRRAYEDEVEQIEYGVPFLATTASAAPFIGLFGTVWGILNAFWKIGAQGSTSLATVGPHIAEALIATAIGLAAAIPAAIFYNLFVGKIRRLSKNLEDFTEDLADRLIHQ